MSEPTSSNKLTNLIEQANALEKFLLVVVTGLIIAVIVLGIQLSKVDGGAYSPISHEHPYSSPSHNHSTDDLTDWWLVNEYADVYHTHDDYADHTHDDYADSYHGHGYLTYSDIYGEFADKNHTHYGCSNLWRAYTTDTSGTYGYEGHNHYFNC